jgi:hypothetical protein
MQPSDLISIDATLALHQRSHSLEPGHKVNVKVILLTCRFQLAFKEVHDIDAIHPLTADILPVLVDAVL